MEEANRAFHTFCTMPQPAGVTVRRLSPSPSPAADVPIQLLCDYSFGGSVSSNYQSAMVLCEAT